MSFGRPITQASLTNSRNQLTKIVTVLYALTAWLLQQGINRHVLNLAW